MDPIEDLFLSGVLNDIGVDVEWLLQKQSELCGSKRCASGVEMVHALLLRGIHNPKRTKSKTSCLLGDCTGLRICCCV